MKKVRVTTTLRNGIKDNQGTAVAHVLSSTFGFDTVKNVRIGKMIDLTLDDSMTDEDIEKIAAAVANPIMDDVKIEIVE